MHHTIMQILHNQLFFICRKKGICHLTDTHSDMNQDAGEGDGEGFAVSGTT